MSNARAYATLEQMQKAEFGATGHTARIGSDTLELLVDRDGNAGWAVRYDDEAGDMLDWDRISESEARELGLWPLKVK